MNRCYVESMCAQAKIAKYYEHGGESDPVAQAFKTKLEEDLKKAAEQQERVELAVLTWDKELHKDMHAQRTHRTPVEG